MPSFGDKSRGILAGCDKRLQDICSRAIEIMDFTIISGHRTKEEQDREFAEKTSKLKWPNSKHNVYPSLAIDIAPYPVNWDDIGRFQVLAGIMLGIAHIKGVKLRWGGDFDGDFNMKEGDSWDKGHFEIIG